MAKLYLILAAVGLVFPSVFSLPWLLDQGPDLELFFAELFTTRIGAFFCADVIVSALTLLLWIWSEGRRAALPHLCLPVADTLCVGVSFGLPLFLYLRDRGRPQIDPASTI